MPSLLTRTICLLVAFILSVTALQPLSAQSRQIVELKTVVIDAGHGGKDPGAVSGNYKEKNITLSIALKLGKMIKDTYPDMKVIYTRSDDRFIPVHRRAEIANKNHADLFISIHLNSARDPNAMGSETFVMGLDKSNSNFEVCQLENSVVVLEDDYSSRYEGFEPDNPESYIIFSLLQNSHLEQSLILASLMQENMSKGPITRNRGVKQNVFLVLWQCTMPSVLAELGFLSNPSDRKILVNKDNHQKIAASLFKSFQSYKKQYDTDIEVVERDTAPVPAVTAASPSTHFRIQVMALEKLLKPSSKHFKGLKCEHIKSGKLYKYTYGRFPTRAEAEKALPDIKKKFPKAYIINVTE